MPTSLAKSDITDWIGESEAAHTWHSLLTERHIGKKNQEEKAHFATFCCGSRRLCLGGYIGDLRLEREESFEAERRREEKFGSERRRERWES